jgi:cadmium resistance protein CadD (predicted permease)
LIVGAVGLFAVTNIDDLVLLTVYFGRARARAGDERHVVIGQYIGFCMILVVSIVGALGANLLPDSVVPYLGLLPLALGVRAAIDVSQSRRDRNGAAHPAAPRGGTAASVATVTFANGGDNIGVYVPVFASAGAVAVTVYVAVFLVLVAVWCGMTILVKGGAFGL